MKILCLCQLFEMGSDAGSERHYYFCKHAVSNGHLATAITSNVDYKNARVKIGGVSGTVRREVAGIDIRYVYSYANFRGSFLKRFYYYLTYFASTVVESFKVKDIDVVYAVSTPLTVGLLGYMVSRLRGVKYVFEVSDVWPDAPVACGVVKNKLLIKLAHMLEMFCYRKADHIIGLSRGICDNIISKGISPEKVSLVSNGVDFSLFDIAKVDPAAVREKYGFGDHFVAMYLGAHGAYNSLDTIIETALLVRNDPRFLFVMVGDGDEKVKLKQKVAENELDNVKFLDTIPRTETVRLLAVADVFLLPNRKGEFFKGNLPNKLFDFLASAKPIIVAGAGETPALVLAAECGRVGPAEDSQAMSAYLVELAGLPVADRLEMGVRGRRYVRSHYDRKMLSDTFLGIASNAVRR